MNRPYRAGVGVMLLNAQKEVWVGQRRDNRYDAWQMPQGGIDRGEEPQAAALRELEEETGIGPHLVEVLGQAPEPLTYDLPTELVHQLWKGRYRGQSQIWFAARFLGTDADVNIDTADPEFRTWRWVDAHLLPEVIVSFKHQLYVDILASFAPYLAA